MLEIEDGGGPLEKDIEIEHGYHPTPGSFPIKKKNDKESVLGTSIY